MHYYLLLVGDHNTGKSQVLNVYVNGKSFDKGINGTVGTEFGKMEDQYGQTLEVWSHTHSAKKGRSVPRFTDICNFILLFYSIEDLQSFNSLDKWLDLIHPKGSSKYDVVLVGNKVDLEDERKVSKEKAEDFASRHGLQHFEISARTKEECSSPFDYCSELCHIGRKKNYNERNEVAEKIKKEKFPRCGVYIPFHKKGRSFKLRFEKGVLSIGENKYKQWIDKTYPNPVELQDGRIDELIKYCNSDSIPHFICDVQELHNEIQYWNSSKVVQKSLNRCEIDIYEDLFLIRRGEEYCVNREKVCRTSKLLCKFVSNSKGSSIVFLEIKGDEFSSLVFDIFVEFHRVSDYIKGL